MTDVASQNTLLSTCETQSIENIPLQNITFTEIIQPVQQSFASLETKISLELTSQVPLIEKVAQYTIKSGGKRLRPLLTLLAAKACSEYVSTASGNEVSSKQSTDHPEIMD